MMKNHCLRLSLLVLRGLRYHRRTHASALLGVTVAGAVLSGALFVGDSVKESLRWFALARLGDARFALESGGRPFPASLADRLQAEMGGRVAPLLRARGIALARGETGEERRLGGIQVLGVDERFWALAPGDDPALGRGEAALGERLAAELMVGPGDRISLRLGVPAPLPRDAPLSSRRDPFSQRASFTVKRILPDDGFGRFSLEASQAAPRNAFVSLAHLGDLVRLPGKADLILAADGPAVPLSRERMEQSLARVWNLADTGLSVEAPAGGGGLLLLSGERVFLNSSLSAVALAVPGAVGSLTWLADSISRQGGVGSVPYPFICALTPSGDAGMGPVPAGMGDGEIVINRSLARALAARPGDRLTLAYFRLNPAGTLVKESRSFSVRRVAEMEELGRERHLAPAFPGLTDVDTCRDWQVGMPLDQAKLADRENEWYWSRYRATPRAFVTLSAGREMWANRFGDLTGVRYPAPGRSPEEMAEELEARIGPREAGMTVVPVRDQALASVAEATDMGGLFLGMSAFLLAAALLLAGLLFAFGMQQRAEEMGTLLAVGLPRGRVAAAFLGEGSVLSLWGSLAGLAMGSLYARALIQGLGGIWRDAVAGAVLTFHARVGTAAVSAAATGLSALAAMGFVLIRQLQRPPRELLAEDLTQDRGQGREGCPRLSLVLFLAAFAAAAALMGAAVLLRVREPALAFFAAGALLLTAGVLLAWSLLGRAATGARSRLTLPSLGFRNASRRRGRSLAAAGMAAAGSFLLAAVSAMGHDPGADAGSRWSGTGGFALYGETTLPVLAEDLQDTSGPPGAWPGQGSTVVPVRLKDGDDASCFNLNRAQAPRLLGVDVSMLSRLGAFLPEKGAQDPWELLERLQPDGAVPALAGDADTARWNLDKRTGPGDGDVIHYRDERGNLVPVRLVGALPVRKSIFQGTLIVSAASFSRLYPSEEGYRVLLVDAPRGGADEARRMMESRLERHGLEITSAAGRVEAFSAVERSYRRIFLVLGGLGLLLGTMGMGAVVARNVFERRSELALLRAVGLSCGSLRRMLLAEHLPLFLAGMLWGMLSALAAVAPVLASPGARVPWGGLALILSAVAAGGLLWTWAAASLAVRGDLMSVLRND